MAVPICLRLAVHFAACPRSRACCKAGISIAAKIAMIAITTSSSIKVKGEIPVERREKKFFPSPGTLSLFRKSGGMFTVKAEFF